MVKRNILLIAGLLLKASLMAQGPAGDNPQMMVNSSYWLADKLDMSETQQQQLKTIFLESVVEINELKNRNLDKRRAAMKAIYQERQQKVKQMITQSQLALFEEIVEARQLAARDSVPCRSMEKELAYEGTHP